mgnify:CR=1 FL=1
MQAKEPGNDEENPTDALSGVQSEGGASRTQGRADAGRIGAAIRRPSESDHGMEAAVAGACGRCARYGWVTVNGAAVDVKTLHAKIGRLMLENDFLAGALGKERPLHCDRESLPRFRLIHKGSRTRPDQVAPVLGSRYLGATAPPECHCPAALHPIRRPRAPHDRSPALASASAGAADACIWAAS